MVFLFHGALSHRPQIRSLAAQLERQCSVSTDQLDFKRPFALEFRRLWLFLETLGYDVQQEPA